MSFSALMRGGLVHAPEWRKPMDEPIIATYCLCDALLPAMHPQAEAQGQMSDAEVMPTAFMAAWRFRGKHASARTMRKH
jgi:hypothetical protein